MTLESNIQTLIRPSNRSCRGDEGRHTSYESVSQFRVSNSPNPVGSEHEAGVDVEPHVDAADVATNTSQNGEYITPKTKRVGETYQEKLLIKHGSDKSLHPIGDIDLWHDCSGGKVKGRTYGTSSLLDPHFLMTGMPSTPSNCRSHDHEGSTSEVLRLEEKLEQQREDGVRRESAVRKEFEDQREDDRREWQAKLKEFQDIVLGKSPRPLPPS